ncbi:hypothetical protein KR009_003610 [Drosophila setifemur]|nr:hypothetical protein KR009_003610 [Drosophila setifemur]
MGAARSPNGPNEWLRNEAHNLGLDDAGLNELWRTREPLVIRNQSQEGEITTVTYELSPDGTAINRRRFVERRFPGNQPIWHSSRMEANSQGNPQQDFEFISNPTRQQFHPIPEPDLGLNQFFNNPFINPLGVGFPQWTTLFGNLSPPPGVTPQVTTKTETDALGRKITTTVSTYNYRYPGTPGLNPLPGPSAFDQLFNNIPGFGTRILPNNPPSNQPNNPPNNQPNAPSPPIGTRPTFSRGPIDTRPTFLPPPNERNPNGNNPNENNPNENNSNESNPNESNWVPVENPTTTRRPVVPLPTLAPSSGGSDTTIDDFLAKVDITPTDIEEEDGELVRTIVDKKGRVLSARFVLSSVKGEGERPTQPDPTK